MYIQMSATRVRTVKQVRSGYKDTHYIITLTAKFWKVNKVFFTVNCIVLKELKVKEVTADLRNLYLFCIRS